MTLLKNFPSYLEDTNFRISSSHTAAPSIIYLRIRSANRPGRKRNNREICTAGVGAILGTAESAHIAKVYKL